jgi:hypothetical protein
MTQGNVLSSQLSDQCARVGNPTLDTVSPHQMLKPFEISAFWRSLDVVDTRLVHRDQASQLSLFTYDIAQSLPQKERDLFIHA